MKRRKFQCFSASVEAVISADSILLITDVLLVFNFFSISALGIISFSINIICREILAMQQK